MNKLTRTELTGMATPQLNLELKRVASIKCNLKKRKDMIVGSTAYNEALAEILSYEDLIKEVKYSLANKGKTYFEFEESDIDLLDIETLIKFRKGIESKKCREWADFDVVSRCDELLAYSKKVLDEKRLAQEDSVVTKIELRTLLENYEMSKDIDLLITSLQNLLD